MNASRSPEDGIPWRSIVRSMLGLVFAIAIVCTPLAFAYAYPHCSGARMTNCGWGPALALFGSMMSSGLALIVGVLLRLLWRNKPMSRGIQTTCQLFTALSAIYLIGCLVLLNL